ncbi:MAG: glycosyltransferase [Oscillochloridaceae bacterium umkhey_bin13]
MVISRPVPSRSSDSGSAPKTVQLSVIIPCLNLGSVIGDQLAALAAQQYDQCWEVLIADNGSTDATRAVVERFRRHLPNLRYLDASAVRGSSHARNVGATAATGDYLIFIDADDIIGQGFLAAMSNALDQHEFAAPRIDALVLNRTAGSQLGQHPQYNNLMHYYNPPYLYHVSGTGIAIRRTTFERLGGFDEAMLRLQDSEFCFRAQLNGIAIAFVPEATMFGRNRRSLKEIMRQSYNWGKAEVKLVERYRAPLSLPRLIYLWVRYLARWAKLLLWVLQWRSVADRNRWAQEVARQLGIAEAALRLRKAPI